MEVFSGHRALLRPLVRPAVAIGNFDGVHLGHQRLLDEAVAAAGTLGGDAVAYTFDPHPARVLNPTLAPALICSLERRLELIAARGITATVVEPFDRAFAATTPEQFLGDVLARTLGAACIVVGWDFTYGARRGGTTDSLRAYGAAHGIDVRIIEPVTVDGIVAASTRVRNFVAAGNLAGARLLLGRDFDVDGTVVRGAGRGRTIGIPTANLRHAAELLPPPGVYAVRARVVDGDRPDQVLLGAANLGTNPTFVKEGELSLEVHILDHDADLYDRRLRVSFVERLRGERRFDGPAALVAQIQADIAQARAILRD
ncbi:MAG TPA: bifunctional riboflavin kinase/FAD synthetase [Kofleriaceae bacterium]|jgi:riboflavin kinase/FMN adenylyltransferase|nr:bifunctional riboflavin kinase/FAD synthetase [Kofleriaceae bacterium]